MKQQTSAVLNYQFVEISYSGPGKLMCHPGTQTHMFLYSPLPFALAVQLLSCVWLFAPQGLQHTRLLCPPLSPGVCSNSSLLSWWCYLSISSSAALFSFCLQSIPAPGSFPVSRLFTSGGQSIGASASASVLATNIKGWFPLGLTGLILWAPQSLANKFLFFFS